MMKYTIPILFVLFVYNVEANVCDRSTAIKQALIERISKPCDLVTPKDLSALRDLRICGAHSKLKVLKSNDLSGLVNLKFLSLESCDLKSVETGALIELNALEIFNASYNHLTMLPSDWLRDSSRLSQIHLANNALDSRILIQLPPSKAAMRIVLANNRIREIPETAFSGRSIVLIHLSGNLIQSIPEKLFSGQIALTKIDLSKNKIKKIPETLFYDLPQVHSINLADNLIEEIHLKPLQHIKLLEEIRLDGNKIESIPCDLFKDFSNLYSLTLSGNSIRSVCLEPFEALPPSFDYLNLDRGKLAEPTIQALKTLLGDRIDFL